MTRPMTTSADLVAALDLPAGAFVNRRVPKSLLLENVAPTAADRRLVSDGIEEVRWVAALKPATVGVPEFRDERREYVEIAVLSAVLRASARVARLVELLHRAVPYPIVLLVEHDGVLSVSLAHKRRSEAEAERIVLDETPTAIELAAPVERGLIAQFLEALALKSQPRASLYALYQGWLDTLLSFRAACVTGAFEHPLSLDRAARRRDALRERERLSQRESALLAAGRLQRQVRHLAEINMELQRVRAELASTTERL